MPFRTTVLPVLLLASILASPASGQLASRPASDDQLDWLLKHAIPVRTIDPLDGDFTDLRALKQSIGNARVVFLGGNTEPAAVKAKYRLIRFLHEEMGFDALVSGADLFDCEQAEIAMQEGKRPGIELRSTIDGAFGSSKHGRDREPPGFVGRPFDVKRTDVTGYLQGTHKSGNPLHLTGAGRFLPSSALSAYRKSLFAFVDAIDPKLLSRNDRAAIQRTLQMIQTTFSPRVFWARDAAPARGAIVRLDYKLAALAAGSPRGREISFYRQTLADLAASLGSSMGGHDPYLWYAGVWRPNSKLIVWSSNASVAQVPLARRTPRGVYLLTGEADFARQFYSGAYTIAFDEIKTADSVLQFLVAGPQPHLDAVANNLESLLHSVDLPYAFLDLHSLPQDHWLRQPLTSTLLGSPMVSRWPGRYDAIFSIDLPSLKEKK